MTLVAVSMENSQGRPPLDVQARRIWNRADRDAVRLGHVVSKPDWDTETSLIGFCVQCDGLLAVDPNEKPCVFGEIADHPCSKGDLS